MHSVTREFVRMGGDTPGTFPRQSRKKGHLPLEDPLEMKATGSEVPLGVGGGSKLHRGSSEDISTSELVNMTLFEKGVFEDVMKLRTLR